MANCGLVEVLAAAFGAGLAVRARESPRLGWGLFASHGVCSFQVIRTAPPDDAIGRTAWSRSAWEDLLAYSTPSAVGRQHRCAVDLSDAKSLAISANRKHRCPHCPPRPDESGPTRFCVQLAPRRCGFIRTPVQSDPPRQAESALQDSVSSWHHVGADLSARQCNPILQDESGPTRFCVQLAPRRCGLSARQCNPILQDESGPTRFCVQLAPRRCGFIRTPVQSDPPSQDESALLDPVWSRHYRRPILRSP